MIQTLVRKFIEVHGFRIAEGDPNDVTPIMPLMLLDLQYTYYQKFIRDLEVGNDLKVVRKKWIEGYNKFNQKSFRIYSKEEKDEIIEMMDDIESCIIDDMRALRAQIMNCLPEDTFEVQNIYATCATCNVLSRLALYFYAMVFRDRLDRPIRNNCIKSVQDNSILFGFMYRGKYEHRNIAEVPNVDNCITAMCLHITQWMKRKREEGRSQS